MEKDFMSKIKDNITAMEKEISDGKKLIAVLKSAGENPVELETKFRDLEKKRDKWISALKEHGY